MPDSIQPDPKTRPHPELVRLAARVGVAYGIPVDVIRGPSQQRRVSQARQAVAWLARHTLSLSYADIGAFLGERGGPAIRYAVAVAKLPSVAQLMLSETGASNGKAED